MPKRGHGWTRPRPHWKRPLPGRTAYTFKIDVYKKELDDYNNLWFRIENELEIQAIYRSSQNLRIETERGPDGH